MEAIKYSPQQQLWNFLLVVKYSLFVCLALVYVPWTAYGRLPGSLSFGNLFHELDGPDIFFLTVAMCGTAWSVVFVQGLAVQGLPIRMRVDGLSKSEQAVIVDNVVPGWVLRVLQVPLTRSQIGLMGLLSVSGLFVINRFGAVDLAESVPLTLGGVLVAIVIALVPAVLVRIAFPDYGPLSFLPERWRHLVWSALLRVSTLPLIRSIASALVWAVRRARRLFVYVAWVMGARYLIRKQYRASHFLAVVAVVTLVAVLILIRIQFSPNDEHQASAAFYVYVWLMLVIWLFAFLDFHCSRWRLSPLVVLAFVVIVGDAISQRDHYYDVVDASGVPTAGPPRADRPGNLVVVTSTGGGIVAAGWTTWAVKELVSARPDMRREIGLVSAISGGSMGTAFLIDGLDRCRWSTPPGADALDPADRRCLRAIHERSVASSLAAAAFGLAYPDFWRLVTAGLLPIADVDRGTYLEDSWRRIAAAELGPDDKLHVNGGSRSKSVLSFSDKVRAGELPDFILSSSVMESGRRVMMTPTEWQSPCLYGAAADAGSFRGPDFPEHHGKQRGCTLTEYIDGPAPIDLDVFTAARLSATFPWVSPAARAKLSLDNNVSRHHLVDGGYYDNFGVTGALDWLEPVMRANRETPILDRVAFVELRASTPATPSEASPDSGSLAAIVGPILSILDIYEGSALERNRIAVDRFLSKWAHIDDDAVAPQRAVAFERFVFETSPALELPLSWKLSDEQKRSLREEWQRKDIQDELDRLVTFLDGRAN